MGWNKKSLDLMPYGYGEKFPAFLTHRAGVDKILLDIMRPAFDKGMRPHAFAGLLLELHSKKYSRDYLNREHELEKLRFLGVNVDEKEMFSEFSDKSKYAGSVPGGHYLGTVYKQFHATISNFMDIEVKKRGASRLHIDASYKEPNHLSQLNGANLFKALITATNEYGEIRVQLHAETDDHEQMRSAFEAFKTTISSFGQPSPNLMATDNPKGDKKWLQEVLPSLVESENGMNNLKQPSLDKELCSVLNTDHVVSVRREREVGKRALALKVFLNEKPSNQKVIGLDAEWEVSKNRRGFVYEIKKIAIIQLAFKDEEVIRAIILQLDELTELPEELILLLSEPTIVFVGVNVGGDIVKLKKDFCCPELVVNQINLGKFARQRDVVHHGTVTLSKLVSLTLHEKLDKLEQVRFSKWSNKKLTVEQETYAALDAIKSLQVYFHLRNLPDLNARLKSSNVAPNQEVDIVPSRGSVTCMATRAAIGIIASNSEHRFKEKTYKKEHTNKENYTRTKSVSATFNCARI